MLIEIIYKQTTDAVTAALKAGYRHIDAAAIYGKEPTNPLRYSLE